MSAKPFFRKQDVENKAVIDSLGKAIGIGQDIAFSLDGRLALVVKTPKGDEVEIPMTRILGVTDYIVLSPEPPSPSVEPVPMPRTQPVPTSQTPAMSSVARTCPNCGMALKPGAKFCTGCGKPTPVEPTHSGLLSKFKRP